MEANLHVLNGDATFNNFKETGIDGDILVWREVLSEGPIEENIASGGFWKSRSEWICQTFKDTPENYEEKILNQLPKLSDAYQEIDLWFDFDLHCQINMLGVIMMLRKNTNLSGPAIYLICAHCYPGVSDFKGIGQLNEEQLEYLYDNVRVRLGEPDFFIAGEAWEVYCSGDAERLSAWLNESNYWGNLHCLKQALEAHLKRLEINTYGNNYIEQKLIDIYKSGINQRSDIYEAFWQTEKIYGMGNMEIDIYLNNLKEKQLIGQL